MEAAQYLLTALSDLEELCAAHPQLKTLAHFIGMARLEAAVICNPGKDVSALVPELKKGRTPPRG